MEHTSFKVLRSLDYYFLQLFKVCVRFLKKYFWSLENGLRALVNISLIKINGNCHLEEKKTHIKNRLWVLQKISHTLINYFQVLLWLYLSEWKNGEDM